METVFDALKAMGKATSIERSAGTASAGRTAGRNHHNE